MLINFKQKSNKKKMKTNILKLSLVTAVVAFGMQACKKTPEVVSEVVTASEPTITLTGKSFYSINVGAAAPAIAATAYDSILKEAYPVSLDVSGIDASTPGLYTAQCKATNKYGYIGTKNVYVAVTNVDPAWNLSGVYKRTSNQAPVNVTEVENGLYEIDDVGGAPTFQITAYMIMLNDSTIDVPLQPTEAGDLYCQNEKLIIVGTDTSYQWVVRNASFGTANRTFVKQP